jgi:hypothetical protein
MSDIKDWSNSAGGNTAVSPDGAPEGMPPSGVNDTIREVMASVRREREDAQWFNDGDTPTFATTASFTLVGDKTTEFHINRRVKCFDNSVLYGTVTDNTFSASTRVNILLDSGELSTSLTGVAVSILSYDNHAIPKKYGELSSTNTFTVTQNFNEDVSISGSLNVSGNTTLGGSLDVSGTAAFTSKVTFSGEVEISGTLSLTTPIRYNSIDVSATASLGALRVTNYNVPTGMLIDTSATLNGTLASGSATASMAYSSAAPVITSGKEFMEIKYLPKNSGNLVQVYSKFLGTVSGNDNTAVAALFVNGATAAVAATACKYVPNVMDEMTLMYDYTTSDSSTVVFSLRAGAASGDVVRMNGNASEQKFGGVSNSGMWLKEYKG